MEVANMKTIKWVSVGKLLVATVVLGAVLFQPSHTQARAPIETAQALPQKDHTSRLIVKLRDTKAARMSVLSATHVHSLSAAAGVSLTHFRAMSGDAQVLALPYRMSLAEATAIAERLSADPAVEYAEPDRILRPLLAPNDAQYANQWHYHSYAAVAGGANLPGAWDITTGSDGIVVAVIDTGLVPHADIDSNILDGTGRVVPGYDFVSEDEPGVYFVANDGNGRDADPTDPGDWATAAEVADPNTPCFFVSNSSWHGTHLAGTIGALSNNTTGVAGINWVSRILPVRVLGKCGGYLSDVVDGARWAAGLSVTGVPANANPARVLNLSLGGPGACSITEQNAFNEILAAGAVVVVAAGNENTDAASSSPGNCNGVITVAAVNRYGARAPYSNFGTTVEIAAPGGAQTLANDPNGILSTLNSGTTTAVADTYIYYQGTSMAAPHVAGIVSLMLSANPALTPAQVLTTVQSTARTFPTGTGSDCTITTCGTGIINAAAAVAAMATIVTVVATDAAAAEAGLDPGTFTITRTGSTAAPLTVNYGMTGTATSGTDYNSVGTSVVIAAASATATVTLTPIDDTVFDPSETAILTLAAGAGYSIGAPNSATVNIADNEPTVTVTATDAAAAEALLDTGTFTVTRSVSSASPLTVTYTMSGTAGSGTDYLAPTGSVTIFGGNTVAMVTITPIDDTVYEGNETAILTVSAGAGYGVGAPASATVTLADNEPAPPPSSDGGGGGGGGGGGCSLNRYAQFDPLLPLLLLLSGIVLWRRRVKL
jgi:serine protease